MTSPGLKRPQDFDLGGLNGNASGATSPNGLAANGTNKRSRTSYATPRPDSLHHQPHYPHLAPPHQQLASNLMFRESSAILMPIDDSIIESALQNTKHDNHNSNNNNNNGIYQLTVPEIREICELIARDREQRLREEYDRSLRMKLLEQQFELTAKASFYNHYEQRLPPAAVAAAAALSPPNAALAQALSMQRTTTDPLSIATMSAATNQPTNLTNFFHQQIAAASMHVQQQVAATSTNVSMNNSNTSPSTPVLLVSQIDEQLRNPDALFTLFGVFGDVMRVKILYNKTDQALIQMVDANQAQVAQNYLNSQKVYGKMLRVTRSIHTVVQLPREGNQSDASLTKDFANSPLHRFKIPGSRNYQNIYPPSTTLHISNIPATIDEKDLHKAFSDACGFEFASFKFFPKDRKMALMQYHTTEQATIALIKMHNYQISDDSNLRVSYSKSVMQK